MIKKAEDIVDTSGHEWTQMDTHNRCYYAFYK